MNRVSMQAGPRQVVVVGGSVAAATAADALRSQGFDGSILLVSEEQHPPYSRVPLSKGVLKGEDPPSSALLPSLSGDIDVRLGARAVALNPESRLVTLADGSNVDYDGLIIATGARARRLASPGVQGEHVLRTLDDAAQLLPLIRTAETVVVVGGGFLGMEVASTCADLGLAVTVVDRDLPLRRLLGSWLSTMVVESARDRGVDFVLAPDGVELVGDPVRGVRVGERALTADLVISAVGDLPNTEWLAGSGVTVDGGVVVDSRCRVGHGIVAAGDVVSWGPSGQRGRSPHWNSAIGQARAAAAALLVGDEAEPVRHDPYFWTEQFGLEIKISGNIPADSEPGILAGDPADRSALLQWTRDDSPVASVALNYRLPIVKLKRLGAWGL